jgi:hypothetical protein
MWARDPTRKNGYISAGTRAGFVGTTSGTAITPACSPVDAQPSEVKTVVRLPDSLVRTLRV